MKSYPKSNVKLSESDETLPKLVQLVYTVFHPVVVGVLCVLFLDYACWLGEKQQHTKLLPQTLHPIYLLTLRPSFVTEYLGLCVLMASDPE